MPELSSRRLGSRKDKGTVFRISLPAMSLSSASESGSSGGMRMSPEERLVIVSLNSNYLRLTTFFNFKLGENLVARRAGNVIDSPV